MYGFSISLLMDTKQVHPEVNSKIRDCTPNLIWAEYDRIHIEKISKFNEFFKLDKTVSFWTGSIQSLHLYTNEDEDVLLDINNDSGSNIQIIYDKNRPNINYPLALILSLKINESIFANDDMDFNLNIKQNI